MTRPIDDDIYEGERFTTYFNRKYRAWLHRRGFASEAEQADMDSESMSDRNRKRKFNRYKLHETRS